MVDSQPTSTCPSFWEACFQFMWFFFSGQCTAEGFEGLQLEHHLTVRLCAYTVMNWPWKSICYLLFKQYHLFNLDCASVDQNIQVNESQCICVPSLFVILMKTQEENGVDDLNIAKRK